MKKVLSLLIVLIVLLSSMHLSFATHRCGGELVDARMTFGQSAHACGMMDESITKGISFESPCCENHLSNWTVDKHYLTTSFDLSQLPLFSGLLFTTPTILKDVCFTSLLPLNTNVKPPGMLPVSSVSLPFIGVFRI